MPLLAILVAAAQVGHRINTTSLEEWNAHHREARIQRDVKSAVTIKQRRVLTILLHTFFVCKEHRNACAVLAGIEYLFGGVVFRVEINLRSAEHYRLICLNIITIDCSRECERCKCVENLRLFIAAHNTSSSKGREFDLMLQSTVKFIDEGMI